MKTKKSRIFSAILAAVMVLTLLAVIPVTASAAAPTSYTNLSVNTSTSVSLSAGGNKYFRFVPSSSGTYVFSSSGSYDTVGYLLDANGSQLSYNDDGGTNNNFSISYSLVAGSVYYLQVRFYGSSTSGSFSVKVTGGGGSSGGTTNTTTPIETTPGTNTYTLFNSGRTGSGQAYSSSSNYNAASLNNGGYDIYATTGSSTIRTVTLGLPFTVSSAVNEIALLTIYAYDVDESQGERDLITLVDRTTGTSQQLSGYLSGMDGQWNTTTFRIDPSLFTVGHTYYFTLYESVSGWVVWVRTVSLQMTTDGEPVNPGPSITSSDFSASISTSGVVSATLSLTTSENISYELEYAASNNGNQYGSATSSIDVSAAGATRTVTFSLVSGAPKGTYQIDVNIKNPTTHSVIRTLTVTAGYSYYSVSYNSNGGSNNLPLDLNQYSYGNTVTALFNYVPSRSGYDFLGWSRSRNATTPEFTASGTRTFTISSDTTLYAVWRPEHYIHTESGWSVVREATCTETGIRHTVCTECGEEMRRESIPMIPHSYTLIETVDSTCTSAGHKTWSCSACGHQMTETLPVADHDYVLSETVEPSCDSAGYRRYICSECGHVYVEPIPATGHAYTVSETVAPTCTEAGYRIVTCGNCGETKREILPATGHSYWLTSTVEPTCTENGSQTYTCPVCGATKTQTLEALGHDFGDDNVCDRCGFEIEIHTHTYTVQVIDPTCTGIGYTLHICECGYQYMTDIVEPNGHHWDEGVVTLAATCTQDGIRTYTCPDCGASYTEILPSGHTWTEEVVVPATCTHDGLVSRTCEKCGTTVTEILPAAHTWGEETLLTDPDCTNPGSARHTCEVCGETETYEIDHLGHAFVNGVCTRCGIRFIEAITDHPDEVQYGMFFSVEDVVSNYGPAVINEYGVLLDYNEGATIEKVAVYLTQDGTMWRRCIACKGTGITYATYVPYLSYGSDIYYTGLNSDWINTFRLTEGADGIWRYNDYVTIGVNLQDRDGNLLLSLFDIGQAGVKTRLFDDLNEMKEWLGDDCFEHQWSEWIVTVEPTYYHAGERQRTCALCGTVVTEVIPALIPPQVDGLSSNSNGDGTCVVNGAGNFTGSVLFIPSVSETGEAVTAVAANAFRNNTTLTHVDIPSSVTVIGNRAFSGCTNLTTVVIPEGVTTIGENAFYGCINLTSIVIPDSVTTIGNHAFSQCTSLTSVTLGVGVTSYVSTVFDGCTELAVLTVAQGNAMFHSTGNCVIETATGMLIRGCKTSVIPADGSVTGIGSYAFYNCNGLTAITIPASVTSIGYSAFNGCRSLTELTILEGVTSIGTNAFAECSALTAVEIPGSVTTIESNAFYYCTALVSVTIASGARNIGSYAFAYCYKLEIVILPEGLMSIGQYAFENCYALQEIVIPDSVTGMGSYLFSGCRSLESLTIPFVGTQAGVTSGSVPQFPIGILFGMTSFTGSTEVLQYYYVNSLTSTTRTNFYIPSSLRSVTVTGGNILYGAFQNCSFLTEIILPEDLTEIGRNAFYGCTSLISVTIPAGVTVIGENAFSACSGLTVVNISVGVTRIGSSAFSGCTALAKINFYGTAEQWESVEKAPYWSSGSGSFRVDCYQPDIRFTSNGDGTCSLIPDPTFSAEKLVIPAVSPDGEAVTSIPEYAFMGNTTLTSVTIPASVTSFGQFAFYNCESLTETIYEGTLAEWCAITFETSTSNPTYYSRGLTIGGELIVNLIIPEGVTSIGAFAFCRCSTIRTVSIPVDVTVIGEGAFRVCNRLRNIFYHGTEEQWAEIVKESNWNLSTGSYTLLYHTSYADGIIFTSDGEGTCSIKGYELPAGCTDLVIPSVSPVGDTVTALVDYAFYNITTITSVTIPASVTEIGKFAFYNCYNLVTTEYEGDLAGWCAIRFANAGANPVYYTRSLSIGGTALPEILQIPDGVTSIGAFAFYRCNTLRLINLPASVTEIGENAFRLCNKVKGIFYAGSDAEWDALTQGSGWNSGITSFIFETASVYSDGFIFTSHGDGTCSVRGYDLSAETELTVPAVSPLGDVVTEIPDYGFYYYNYLVTLTLPASLTHVGKAAFYSCYRLENVVFEGTAEEWCTIAFDASTSNPVYYSHNLTVDGALLTRLILPQGTVSVGAYAFYNCYCLEEVVLHDSVTSLGACAFLNCRNLKKFRFVGSAEAWETVEKENGWNSRDNFTVSHYSNGLSFASNGDGTCSVSGIGTCTDAVVVIPTVSPTGETVTGIADFAFCYNSTLTGVVIPDCVTVIGRSAFYDCTALTDVSYSGDIAGWCAISFANSTSNPIYYAHTLRIAGRPITTLILNENVSAVGANAFYGFTALRTVIIRGDLSGIGAAAFQGCTSLTDVAFFGTQEEWDAIPKEANWIRSDSYTFSRFSRRLTYESNGNGTCSVKGIGTCTDTDIVLPWISPDGDRVTAIADYAFCYCDTIASVTIPASVTAVGRGAFYDCAALTNVNYEGTLAGWCAIAFAANTSNPVYYAKRLTIGGVLLTDAVTTSRIRSIGDYAFINCESLTGLYLQESVASIGTSAFQNCRNLSQIRYVGSSEQWENVEKGSRWNTNVSASFVRYSGGMIYQSNGDGTATVTKAGACPDTQIVIPPISPDGEIITAIGDYAFCYCDTVTSVTLPASVISIGKGAFYDCTALTNVVFEGDAAGWLGIAFANNTSNPVYYAKTLTVGGTPLTSVTVPGSMTAIGDYVLINCESLTSVTFEKTVTSIGTQAFRGCRNLSSVVFYGNAAELQAIEKGANWSLQAGAYTVTYYSGGLEYVSNGDGTATVSKIGTCVDTDLIIPPVSPAGDVITAIGDYAFCYCNAITSVTIPASVTVFGRNAFYDCPALTEVNYLGDLAGWLNIGFVTLTSNPTYYAHSLTIGGEELTDLIVPAGVERIGNYAFSYCTGLTRVVLPESLTGIGEEAFRNCRELTEIVWFGTEEEWNDLEKGSNWAMNVPYMLSVYSRGLSYTSNGDGTATVVKIGACTETDLIIPPMTPAGETVTAIADYAFYGCDTLTSVTIPASVTAIGKGAFYGCTALTNVNYTGDLAGWCSIVFANSTSNPVYYAKNLTIAGEQMTRLTIPAEVTSVGAYAFIGCTSLKDIVIGNGLTSIGEAAFQNCRNLTYILYVGNAEQWEAVSKGANWNTSTGVCTVLTGAILDDGFLFLSNGDGTCTVRGYDSFSGTVLTIPSISPAGDRVTAIAEYAFYGYDAVVEVILPAGIDRIGNFAFFNCTALTKVSYGGTLADWCAIIFGEPTANPVYYAHSLYLDGQPVTRLITTDAVTSVGAYAFYNLDSLTEVYLQASVASIGTSAFQNCRSLVAFGYAGTEEAWETMPKGTNWNAGTGSFTLTRYSAGLNFTSNGDGTATVSGMGACTDTDLRIPLYSTASEPVTAIAAFAFYNCADVTSVTIPANVTLIGRNAFFGCTAMADAVYTGDLAEWCAIAFDGPYATPAFYAERLTVGGQTLTGTVTFPEEVTSIGANAFYNYQALTGLILPNTLEAIGEAAFRNCRNLTDLTWYGSDEQWESVVKGTNWSLNTKIQGYTRYSGGLEYISNGDGTATVAKIGTCVDTELIIPPVSPAGDVITAIGDYAFCYCNAITSVTIPASVTSIGRNAFYDCPGLTEVNYLGDLAGWLNIGFVTLTSNPTYYAHSLTIGGEELTELIVPAGIERIRNYAFGYCTELTRVVLPESLTGIGEEAFRNCRGLTEIVWFGTEEEWNDLEKGTNWAMNVPYMLSVYSRGLSYTSNGDGTATVVKIGACTETDLIIPPMTPAGETVTAIADYAFYGCDALTSVTIPASVTAIGKGAFYGCTALTNVNYTGDLAGWCAISFANSTSNPVYYAKNLTIAGERVTRVVTTDAMTAIGAFAFYNLESLTEVYLQASVTSIGESAFRNCRNLQKIGYAGTAESWEAVVKGTYWNANTAGYTMTFYSTGMTFASNGDGTATVSGMGACTDADPVLPPYSTAGEPVTAIAAYAFYNRAEMTSVTLPVSVTSIGKGAFFGCTAMADAVYTGDLAEWCAIAFDGPYATPAFYTERLTVGGQTLTGTVTFPEEVTSIGANAFYNYQALTGLILPGTLEVIGEAAFRNCRNLVSITFLGDTEDWSYVRKGANWDLNTGDYVLMITPAPEPEPGPLFTRVNANLEEDPNGKYLIFGEYPQSEVTDARLISALNAKAGTLPTASDSRKWTSYGYYANGSVQDYMWYIDVTKNGERYRGVYFTSYRPKYTRADAQAESSYQDDYGYMTGTVYWFRYDPLIWRILTESNDVATILCQSIIDSQTFYRNDQEVRTIDGQTVYPNNYEYSDIRAWLNDTFYETAFSGLQQAIIEITTVDNSLRSASYSNENMSSSGENRYICSNTRDKIFLLSQRESCLSSYGFRSYSYLDDTARQLKPTSYALAMGAFAESGEDGYEGVGYWWLRSPYWVMQNCTRDVFSHGYPGCSDYVHCTFQGVVPALRINFAPKTFVATLSTASGKTVYFESVSEAIAYNEAHGTDHPIVLLTDIEETIAVTDGTHFTIDKTENNYRFQANYIPDVSDLYMSVEAAQTDGVLTVSFWRQKVILDLAGKTVEGFEDGTVRVIYIGIFEDDEPVALNDLFALNGVEATKNGATYRLAGWTVSYPNNVGETVRMELDVDGGIRGVIFVDIPDHTVVVTARWEEIAPAPVVVPYTRVSADGTANPRGEYILFGSYPQSEVTDETLKATLNAEAGTLPTASDSYMWTSYGYYISYYVQDYMWYIDVTKNGERYRGVYFTSYRPVTTYSASSTDTSYQDDNGYTTGTVYWFKYDPLLWRILEEENGTALILCESIIDSQRYYRNLDNRTINGETVYPNNYKYSDIRAWLNDQFYNTAFGDLQKQIIEVTTVNNSARSTNFNNDASSFNGGVNNYACNNTQDNVFLLSEQEVTNADYGFVGETGMGTLRCKPMTAYSEAMGIFTGTSYTGMGWWWLRSPTSSSRYEAFNVHDNGASYSSTQVHCERMGVVPALRINLVAANVIVPLDAEEYYAYQYLTSLGDEGLPALYVYRKLVSAAEDLTTTVDLTGDGYNVTYDQMTVAMECYRCDYPQHFWVSDSGFGYRMSGDTVCSIEMEYTLSASEIAAMQTEIDASVEVLLADITVLMSEAEIEMLIHDRLVNACTYDTSLSLDHIHDLYGALVIGTPVCDGYSEAFQYLLYCAGIQSFRVTGEAGGGAHAWTIVRIDGAYYYVDVTWDDPVTEEGEPDILSHNYLNITADLLALDHTVSDSLTYGLPECTATDAQYYVYHGYVAEALTVGNLREVLAKEISDGVADRYQIYVSEGGMTLSDVQTFVDDNSNAILQMISDLLKIQRFQLRFGLEFNGYVFVLVVEEA